jgi:hypothetical protein
VVKSGSKDSNEDEEIAVDRDVRFAEDNIRKLEEIDEDYDDFFKGLQDSKGGHLAPFESRIGGEELTYEKDPTSQVEMDLQIGRDIPAIFKQNSNSNLLSPKGEGTSDTD